jgi:hypothetical protein
VEVGVRDMQVGRGCLYVAGTTRKGLEGDEETAERESMFGGLEFTRPMGCVKNAATSSPPSPPSPAASVAIRKVCKWLLQLSQTIITPQSSCKFYMQRITATTAYC